MPKHVLIIGGGPAGIEAAGAAADMAGALHESKHFGMPAAGGAVDVQRVLLHIAEVKKTWNQRQARTLTALDVEVRTATARFVAPDRVRLTGLDGVDLGDLYGAYPTVSELVFAASRAVGGWERGVGS